jgi:hypothetical protein
MPKARRCRSTRTASTNSSNSTMVPPPCLQTQTALLEVDSAHTSTHTRGTRT